MELNTAFDEFVVYLRVEKNYSENTVLSYSFDYRCLLEFLGFIDRAPKLDTLNTSLCRRFIQDQVLNRKIMPRTVNRRISFLKSFAKFCLLQNYIEIDFSAALQSPKIDAKLPVYMTLDELRQLFRTLENDPRPGAKKSLRNEVIFKLFATSGMRRQELVDLTWQQIDFHQETMKVFGKGKKERLLPLHPMVVPILKKYKDTLLPQHTHPSEPVFLNSRGQAFNPRGLHMLFKRSLDLAGLPSHRYSLHHLRHTLVFVS